MVKQRQIEGMMLDRKLKKNAQYFLMRHPIPLSINEYHALQTGPKVFANSLPKSGTHLLWRLLSLLPNTAPRWFYHFDESVNGMGAYDQLQTVSPGQVVTAHVPYSENILDILNNNGFSKIFIFRDIRDVVISAAHYITNMNHTHRLSKYYKSLPSDNERIMATILGIDGSLLDDGIRSKSMREHVADFMGWVSAPSCLVVKFENLIGPNGGGNEIDQFETIKNILSHLNLTCSESELRKIASKTFSSRSKTFHKGQINGWKSKLTERHKAALKETVGDFLIQLGYENDFDW